MSLSIPQGSFGTMPVEGLIATEQTTWIVLGPNGFSANEKTTKGWNVSVNSVVPVDSMHADANLEISVPSSAAIGAYSVQFWGGGIADAGGGFNVVAFVPPGGPPPPGPPGPPTGPPGPCD